MTNKIDFGISSYVLGILSIVAAFFTPLMGFVLGIVGLVQSLKGTTKTYKVAKVLNIIGMIASVVVFVVTIIFLLNSNAGMIPSA